MHWYLEAFRNYANFSGRASRTAYWMFVLINFIVAIVIGFIEALLGTGIILYSLYILGTFIPSLALCIRRLHDTGKSGWWYLISLIPFIGGIILLVFFATDSEKGDNQYGPNPKGE